LGGFFIGCCYDGEKVFQMLRKLERGKSKILYAPDGTKMWEITKQYDKKITESETKTGKVKTEGFEADSTSVGLRIDVYQESINQVISEYLVHFDYLTRVMEDYGFQKISSIEASQLNIGSYSLGFEEWFEKMKAESTQKGNTMFGDALNMSENEKIISFLNRTFCFKKIRHVDASKIILEKTMDLTESISASQLNTISSTLRSETNDMHKIKRYKNMKIRLISPEMAAASSSNSTTAIGGKNRRLKIK
jgi:hypothetical protein